MRNYRCWMERLKWLPGVEVARSFVAEELLGDWPKLAVLEAEWLRA